MLLQFSRNGHDFYQHEIEKIAIIDGAENVVITGVVKDTSINNWGTPNDTSDDGLNAKTLFSIKY